MKFKTLRKMLTVTTYVIRVVYLDNKTEEVKITRYNIDYLNEITEDFVETLNLLDSLNPLSVKFVGTVGGLLEITLEIK